MDFDQTTDVVEADPVEKGVVGRYEFADGLLAVYRCYALSVGYAYGLGIAGASRCHHEERCVTWVLLICWLD